MTRSSDVRGLSRFDKGDLSGAVADFNQAIQTQSDYAEAYLYRGLAYCDLRQMPKTIADYSKDLALNSGVRMGDEKGAISDLQQADRLFRVQGMNADAQKALDLIGQLQR
jgi:tetratricopeptide (TPR) repeat protein